MRRCSHTSLFSHKWQYKTKHLRRRHVSLHKGSVGEVRHESQQARMTQREQRDASAKMQIWIIYWMRFDSNMSFRLTFACERHQMCKLPDITAAMPRLGASKMLVWPQKQTSMLWCVCQGIKLKISLKISGLCCIHMESDRQQDTPCELHGIF